MISRRILLTIKKMLKEKINNNKNNENELEKKDLEVKKENYIVNELEEKMIQNLMI